MNFLMRKNRKLGMFWWRSELGDGHEGTSGGTMNGDRARRASVRARVESNGQPRMFVINQFVLELEFNTVCIGAAHQKLYKQLIRVEAWWLLRNWFKGELSSS